MLGGYAYRWSLNHRLAETLDRGHSSAVVALVRKGADTQVRGPRSRRTALMYSVAPGFEVFLEELLAQGKDLHARDSTGDTALFYAAVMDNGAAIYALVDAGADVNAVNNLGETPLTIAALSGRVRAVCALLRLRAKVNVRGNRPQGYTPLSAAGASLNAVKAAEAAGKPVALRAEDLEAVIRLLKQAGARE